jgi:SAM-dependent methyltransferase
MQFMESSGIDRSNNVQAWGRVWERQRRTWSVIGWGRSVYNRFFEKALSPYINSQTHMMELGCGTASLAQQLCPRIAWYTGMELVQETASKAEQKMREVGISNASFVCADLLQAPALHAYDLVWSQGLLEHFDDPSPVLQKHVEHCRAGGVVVVSVPRKYSVLWVWYRLTRWKPLERCWPWTEQKFFLVRELEALAGTLPQSVVRHYQVQRMRPKCLGILLLIIQIR